MLVNCPSTDPGVLVWVGVCMRMSECETLHACRAVWVQPVNVCRCRFVCVHTHLRIFRKSILSKTFLAGVLL